MLRREQSRLPGKRKETMLNRNMRNTAILLVVFLAVYMFGNYFAEKNLMSGSGSSSYSYERLESDIAKNKVKSIEVVQNAQVPTGSAIVKLNAHGFRPRTRRSSSSADFLKSISPICLVIIAA